MKPLHWIIIILVALLGIILTSESHARDIASYTLQNGAIVTLTDEPCNLTYKGKPLIGQRSYGQVQDQIHSSCWVQKKTKIYVIWYKSDGKEIDGVTEYDTSDFKRVRTL